jgi:hypothetical protein
MRYWFYIETYGVTCTHDDGTKNTHYPLASVVSEMKPLAKVTPSEEVTPEREAYNRAFALACRYSRGRDIIEEMVASNCWPVGKGQPSFTIEMVNVPIYGPTDGVPFPRFEIELNKGEDPKEFTAIVE